MAQSNIRSGDAATYVGVEGTYGTLPTVRRLTPIAGTVVPGPQQADLDVMDESIYLHDRKTTARGLTDGSTIPFELYARRLSSLLTSSTLDAPAQYRDVTRALLGGQSPAQGGNVGAVLDTPAGTTTSLTVVSAANLAVGQWILVPTANGREPARISGISGVTVSLNPGTSTAPTDGGTIAHCITQYLTDSNALSLSVQHAKAGSADEQYQFVGCTGDMTITATRNELVRIACALRAAYWTRGALSISAAVGGDTVGAPFSPLNDGVFLLQPTATATRTNYNIEEISVAANTGMTHILSLVGGVGGTLGVMRVAERNAVTMQVTIPMDPDQITNWSNQTALQAWLQIPAGSGASRQWLIVGLPKCFVLGVPQPVASSDGRVRYQITLAAQIPDTSGATELIRSPFIFAVS